MLTFEGGREMDLLRIADLDARGVKRRSYKIFFNLRFTRAPLRSSIGRNTRPNQGIR